MAGIGDARRAGVARQRDGQILAEHPLDQLGRAVFLVVPVTGDQRLLQVEVVEQLHRHARVLCGDQIGALERLAHPRGQVAQIADRRGDDVELRHVHPSFRM